MVRSRTLQFLDQIEAEKCSSVSMYFSPALPEKEIENMISSLALDNDLSQELLAEIAGSSAGSVLLKGNQYLCLIQTPFPVKDEQVSNEYDLRPLRRLLKQELIVALILLRLGDYAIGVFKGENRLSSKVGTGLIHSRHRKGGSSQRRFERHREKQMEYFFTRVCSHAKEQLEPLVRNLDYLIYSGEKNTLRIFRKQCHFMSVFDDRVSRARFDVRKPRNSSLDIAIQDVWSSNIIEWFEKDGPLFSDNT